MIMNLRIRKPAALDAMAKPINPRNGIPKIRGFMSVVQMMAEPIRRPVMHIPITRFLTEV
jgi:hypothetical protein